MEDYILDINDFLNEKLDITVISKDSLGKLKIAINKIIYEYNTHSPYIIEQFEKKMKYNPGQALKYLKDTVGDNYKRLN